MLETLKDKLTQHIIPTSLAMILAGTLIAIPLAKSTASGAETSETSAQATVKVTMEDPTWTHEVKTRDANDIPMDNPAVVENDEPAPVEPTNKDSAPAVAPEKLQLSLSGDMENSIETNAMKVYSILSAAGIPDVNIAGVLGNWETESAIDPTAIECIYNEKHYVGPAKQQALADMETHAYKCFAMYENSGLAIAQHAYQRENGEYWPGVGIGGFTGPVIDGLLAWSNKVGRDWLSLEAQVGYAIGDYGRADWLRNWTEPCVSASDAAVEFQHNWEGCGIGYAKRAACAEKWLETISGWEPDLEYGASVLNSD